MKKIIVLILATMVMLVSEIAARRIETAIIQFKLGRVYFASGVEAGVKAGVPFTIECDGRETISGTVEYAGPGISYSRPLPELDSLSIASGCVTFVTTSGVDSAAVITLGTDLPLEFFDPEHETFFVRQGDTVIPNLVDSMSMMGNILILYLPENVRFSDGSLLNAETVAYFLRDLRNRSRSYLARYFFSRLLPVDSGGVELIDAFTAQLEFNFPFPQAAYFLSHPDFAAYNRTAAGTGPFAEYDDYGSGNTSRAFIPNRHYRGDPPACSKIIIQSYEQQYRMKFAYENKQVDGFIGFGFDADLAGHYEAKALYPEVAVMIAGIGGSLFSQAFFPTSLYYSFNPSLAHIYFQYGETMPVNRWLMTTSPPTVEERFYPFDVAGGRKLQASIRTRVDSARIVYDHPLLYETARYLADIVAREGMTAPVRRQAYDARFDIRLAFFPASDEVMPFSLIAAVLEFNDQNGLLPADRRLDRPGWQDLARGSGFKEIRNRNTFFARAEETVIQEGGFFPLFRPYVYAVSQADVKGLDFDYYGFPVLSGAIKFTEAMENETESGP